MPRGHRSSLLLVSLLAASGAGCGALDDVKSTLKEVKQSNTNMEKMQALMEQSNRTSSEINAKTDTTLDEIKKSNANMEKTLELMQQSNATAGEIKEMQKQMLPKMDQSNATAAEIKKMQTDMLPKMDQSNQTATEIGKTAVATLDELKSKAAQMDKVIEISGKTLDAVKETRDETERTRKVIEKEVPLKLHDFLTELSDFVRNTDKENHDRVTSAGMIYHTLAAEHLPPEQLHKFVVEKFEMCDMRAATPSGDLCTDMFMDLPMHWGNTFRTEAKPNFVQKTYRTMREKILKWSTRNNKDDTLPVQPLRPNAIFALALNPEFVGVFYKYMVVGGKDPVAVDFLRFTKRFLKDSMYYTAYFLEKERSGVSSTQILEFQRRQKIVLAIQALPNVPPAPSEKDLSMVVRTFLGAVADQPGQISDDDQKVLDQIRTEAGVDKVVATAQ